MWPVSTVSTLHCSLSSATIIPDALLKNGDIYIKRWCSFEWLHNHSWWLHYLSLHCTHWTLAVDTIDHVQHLIFPCCHQFCWPNLTCDIDWKITGNGIAMFMSRAEQWHNVTIDNVTIVLLWLELWPLLLQCQTLAWTWYSVVVKQWQQNYFSHLK